MTESDIEVIRTKLDMIIENQKNSDARLLDLAKTVYGNGSGAAGLCELARRNESLYQAIDSRMKDISARAWMTIIAVIGIIGRWLLEAFTQ